MPGVLSKTDSRSVANKAWTLAEMVDETRGKLHLKERDANAYYESCEVNKMQGEQCISNLRKDNKQKRKYLASCTLSGNEAVIRTACHHRKKELLSLQRFTPEKAMKEMDQRVSEVKNCLNLLKYEKKKKQHQYRELQHELEHMTCVHQIDNNEEIEQEIRRIQNEMDKANIKVGAAKNITRRYEAITDTIQEEVRNYPAILDCLEEKLEECKTESKDLLEMKVKAVSTSEEARRDLHTMEREMYQAKRARDQKLNDMKKEVEKRKEQADRPEKKQRVALISDTSDSRQARIQGERIERQEKILSLEDAFERIMNATRVSDIEDIIYRLEHQDHTYQQLRNMEKEKMMMKTIVTEKLTKLRKVFGEIKFTSERQSKKGRLFVEGMADYVQQEEKRRNNQVDSYQRHNKLLMNLQSGTATLLEKLKDVRLKPPYHNFVKGKTVEDLLQCGRKVDLLLTNLGMKAGLPYPSYRVESKKLHEYLESKLPADNIRIRIDTDDHSDTDEFHFDHDQENDGFTSREDIKRQGQEIVNSRLKPKKKKSRKRSN